MIQKVKLTAEISRTQLGKRLDQALAELFNEYSRSQIQQWILSYRVNVNGIVIDKPDKKISGGEHIVIHAEIKEDNDWKAQNIPLNILFEDDDILVINKPSALVVHPGAGNSNNTLLNALLYHFPLINNVPRAGIVHRLDKDTTGLMVVAKNISSQVRLMEMLKLRKIVRIYEAIVVGVITVGGVVNASIGRHPKKRVYMSVNSMGKPAVTYYRIIENFRLHTRLYLRLQTGRTHQIRVHMAHLNHPIVGDPLYSRYKPEKGASEEVISKSYNFNRQALHAKILRFYHPKSNIAMEWCAPIPKDMMDLTNILRIDKNNHFPYNGI
ncbi:23S rRNA pseudouridine(1911/1915/1917) synthase RluD [Candidatus Pantoea carbekii]|uniref:Pseudouridine synthase n=1 Tax=Candidatus Pantoea carbekii TaxID=1235990 RepID=U3U239_9GAMM|nr:23S rRNA pseudouridine(1911/1915/1917) synthase RluD [Candidatus Pantoea carbekii]AKC32440.1 ribosomal large subunit pseudouridine synthase D [Candidatus Pantoea carbekii]BAO00166.1 23S rRNA pseudouridine synthase D [Candidatus Pantoea carbekii]